MNKIKIEVCAFSVQSVINAHKAGAYRVELCSNYPEGGTTPSAGMIELARKSSSIKINVLIRPRGGDFLYSGLEFETIIKDITIAKQLGADGIVTGILDSGGKIDKEKMKEVIKTSAPLPVTFHRAFDCSSDPFEAMESLIELGAARILSSGTKATASEGKELLAMLVENARGRIIIMPGSGIDSSNIKDIARTVKAGEYHLSGKSIITSRMNYVNNEINFSSFPSGGYIESDEYRIKQVIEILNGI